MTFPALRHFRGFTLLEIMAVMAIIGLVFALAAPKIGAGFQGAQLKTSVKKFAATLRTARSIAVARRARVAVAAELGTGKYALRIRYAGRDQGKTGGADNDLPDFFNTPQSFPPDIIFQDFLVSSDIPVPVDTGVVMFYPRGNATGGAFVIGVQDGPQYAVNIDFVTGRVSIEAVQ